MSLKSVLLCVPLIGLAIAVIALPGKPINWRGGKPRTAYKAAKQAVKAAFLAGDLHSIDVLASSQLISLKRLFVLLKIE